MWIGKKNKRVISLVRWIGKKEKRVVSLVRWKKIWKPNKWQNGEVMHKFSKDLSKNVFGGSHPHKFVAIYCEKLICIRSWFGTPSWKLEGPKMIRISRGKFSSPFSPKLVNFQALKTYRKGEIQSKIKSQEG